MHTHTYMHTHSLPKQFHIHCGQPGVLGPILVDFSLFVPDNDVSAALADDTFTFTVEDKHIAETAGSPPMKGEKLDQSQIMNQFTMGCPIQSLSLSAPVKESTVAGMVCLFPSCSLSHK